MNPDDIFSAYERNRDEIRQLSEVCSDNEEAHLDNLDRAMYLRERCADLAFLYHALTDEYISSRIIGTEKEFL